MNLPALRVQAWCRSLGIDRIGSVEPTADPIPPGSKPIARIRARAGRIGALVAADASAGQDSS